MTAPAARFHDSRQRAGAQVIVAALTAETVYGATSADALLDAGIADTLDELDAYDLAGAAATLIHKLYADVSALLGVEVAGSVAMLGAWVAAGELEEA